MANYSESGGANISCGSNNWIDGNIIDRGGFNGSRIYGLSFVNQGELALGVGEDGTSINMILG